MDMKQLEQLVANPWFRSVAPGLCRECGINVPAGVDPGAMLLAEVYEKTPHAFESFVHQAQQISLAESAPPVTKEQATLRAQLAKNLPPDRVAAAWKALPANSPARASAKSPEFEAWARDRMARAGLAPLPGHTAGETVAAYLIAAGSSPAMQQGRDAFRELAAATGGAFGDEKTLRQSVRTLGTELRTEQTQRQTVEAINAVAEKSRKHEAEVRKGRSLPKSDQKINPKFRDPNSIERKDPDLRKKNTRDTVAELYQDAGGNVRPPLVINDRKRLASHLAVRKGAGQSTTGLELTPRLRKEIVSEMRAQGYRVETDSSQMRDDDILSAPETKSAAPDWKPIP